MSDVYLLESFRFHTQVGACGISFSASGWLPLREFPDVTYVSIGRVLHAKICLYCEIYAYETHVFG